MVARRLLFLLLLFCTTHALSLSVVIEQVLDAPQGLYGTIFGYSDRLEYLDNGTLMYIGTYPPNLYTVEGAEYSKLIEKYENSIYETRDPDRVAKRLLASRVQGEWLYYVRTTGAEQENYRIIPRSQGGASVELVSKAYLEKNADRRVPSPEDASFREKYYSLGGGYFLYAPESKTIEGGLNIVIESDKSGSVFVLDEVFPVGFVEHLGHVAISPDKNHAAMIISYHQKGTERSVNRLVILRIEHGDSGSGAAEQN